MRDLPKPMERYRHFKGRLYQVLMLATKEDTGETLVIYQALYGSYGIFARELSNFLSPVDREKYPDAVQEYRFEKVEEAEPVPQEEKESSEPQKSYEEEEQSFAASQEESTPETEESASGEPLGIGAVLDARSIAKKKELLLSMRKTITSSEIDLAAMSIGVEIEDGPVEKRFEELLECLDTIGKYEIGRDRLKSE